MTYKLHIDAEYNEAWDIQVRRQGHLIPDATFQGISDIALHGYVGEQIAAALIVSRDGEPSQDERLEQVSKLAEEYAKIHSDREQRERRQQIIRLVAEMNPVEALYFAREAASYTSPTGAAICDMLTVLGNRVLHLNEGRPQ